MCSEAWSFCIDRHSALGTPNCNYGQIQYSTTSKTIRTVQALEYFVWDFESASGEIKQAKSNFERTKSLTSSDTFLKNNFRRETETEIKSSVEIILKRWPTLSLSHRRPTWAHFGNITWIWCNIYFTSIKRYVIHMTHISYKKKKRYYWKQCILGGVTIVHIWLRQVCASLQLENCTKNEMIGVSASDNPAYGDIHADKIHTLCEKNYTKRWSTFGPEDIFGGSYFGLDSWRVVHQTISSPVAGIKR